MHVDGTINPLSVGGLHNNDVLPTEILETIFLSLDSSTLLEKIDKVCQTWKKVLENEQFWKEKIKRDDPKVTFIEDDTVTMRRTYFLLHNLPKNYHPMGGPIV